MRLVTWSFLGRIIWCLAPNVVDTRLNLPPTRNKSFIKMGSKLRRELLFLTYLLSLLLFSDSSSSWKWNFCTLLRISSSAHSISSMVIKDRELMGTVSTDFTDFTRFANLRKFSRYRNSHANDFFSRCQEDVLWKYPTKEWTDSDIGAKKTLPSDFTPGSHSEIVTGDEGSWGQPSSRFHRNSGPIFGKSSRLRRSSLLTHNHRGSLHPLHNATDEGLNHLDHCNSVGNEHVKACTFILHVTKNWHAVCPEYRINIQWHI